MPKTFTDFRENRAQDMIKYYDGQKTNRTLMLKYDRNPTKIVSALKQMGKRLKLTAKKKGKEYAIKGDLRDLNMFMRYLNTKGIEPDVKLEDVQKEDMSKFYSDPKMGIGKPKTFNVKTQKFDEDAPTNSAGAGNVAGIGVGPDGEPGIKKKKKKNPYDGRRREAKQFFNRMTEKRKSKLAAQAAKQVENFNHEYSLVENNIEMLRDIVKKKQNKPVRFKDGQMKVDLMTASAITQVYDKVNSSNRAKIDKMINSRRADFLKISSAVFKMINK
jgi:hypothetical protein|tara:strand:+ start:2398 stop:3216 length:819 start_codon:yes stop_codon:yes gene_type:complete